MKSENKTKLLERAARALGDLYHNATPRYPSLDGDRLDKFEAWFRDAAEFEIEYINDGGAYGRNYLKTVQADCNAGRYKSERARVFYIGKAMRAMRQDRSGGGRWERITEYGRCYTYGRGGRTLAPESLTRGHRGFNAIDVTEWNAADVTELCLTVEAFNSFVEQWCKSVPAQFEEYYQENHIAGVEEAAELGTTG